MTKSLQHYNPFFEGMIPLDFPRFWRDFDDMFADLPGFQQDGWTVKEFPLTDIINQEDKSIVEMPLAGYSKEQLGVKVEDRTLVITASKCEDKGCSRLAARAFKRSLRLGDAADIENITSTFENGLLRIVVPLKKEALPVSKDIEIQ